MIKCNAKVCGIVTYPAQQKTNSEGKPFVAFTLEVTVPSTKGDPATLHVSVAADSADMSALSKGRRVEVQGLLKIKGAPNKGLYFNMSAESITLDPVSEAGISGTMEFKGTLCKDIATPTDKKGNPYLRFSAYSTDKVGEEFYSVFVRFVRFSSEIESYIEPKGKIEAKGDLRVTAFNGHVDLQCKVDEMKRWEKLPF